MTFTEFYMYWFTDLLDTWVVMWFPFKLDFQFLSWANKLLLFLLLVPSPCAWERCQPKSAGAVCFYGFIPRGLSCFGLDLKAQWVLWSLQSAWLWSVTFWEHFGKTRKLWKWWQELGLFPVWVWNGIKGSREKTGAWSWPRGWPWARWFGSRLASRDRILPSSGLVRGITSIAWEDFREPACVPGHHL